MIIHKIDEVVFRLRKHCDVTWLKKYGTAFWAMDETGSGCLCIGMQKDNKKYFCKIAGVDTIGAELSPIASVTVLKKAMSIYEELKSKHLIRIIEHYAYKNLYVAIFEWADGECLFDHWNFDMYADNPSIRQPKDRFKNLPVEKKLKMIEIVFSFLQTITNKNYVAIDFYDGSIMYDFITDTTTICDIDLFRKKPVINDMGEAWYGTKRLKAPEEYREGAIIDEITNVFTLGALLFEFFGYVREADIKKGYTNNQFSPCSITNWQLCEDSYLVAVKAVNQNRRDRYTSISEFHLAWIQAIRKSEERINIEKGDT